MVNWADVDLLWLGVTGLGNGFVLAFAWTIIGINRFYFTDMGCFWLGLGLDIGNRALYGDKSTIPRSNSYSFTQSMNIIMQLCPFYCLFPLKCKLYMWVKFSLLNDG